MSKITNNELASNYKARIICTSLTRPSNPTVGLEIYETDTLNNYTWNGSAWENKLATHKAEAVYLQEDEPEATNSTTLWFDVSSEINFSEGGVAIYNAETSTTPPETVFWFQPV